MNNAGIIDLVPAAVRSVWEQDGTYPNRSVYQLFREHAERAPHKPAVLEPDSRITYGELHDAALRMAASLRSAGIVAGDVVAYQLTNSWRS